MPVLLTSLFPTIFTPQGDGNGILGIGGVIPLSPFPTIFTPQGDGNKIIRDLLRSGYQLNSRQYLPRKGTETWIILLTMVGSFNAFPTIFTPQGDGNQVALILS